jgi:hypothetical protein
MANLSPSVRFLVAGAGAAFMALLASPLAQADEDASAELSFAYGDALIYEQSWGLPEEFQFYSDLASPGNLLSASGVDLGDPFPSGASASDDVNMIVTEGNTLTSQLADLRSAAGSDVADYKEFPVISDALSFQEQINNSVADLSPTTAQDETNPLVIAELSVLYGNEVDLGNNLVNLGDALTIGDPAGITSDNAAIVAEGLGILSGAQGASETLTFLADLTSVGL